MLLVTQTLASRVAKSGFIYRGSTVSPLVCRSRGGGGVCVCCLSEEAAWGPLQSSGLTRPFKRQSNNLRFSTGFVSDMEKGFCTWTFFPDVSACSKEEHLSPKPCLHPTTWNDSGERKIPATIKAGGEKELSKVLGEIVTALRNMAKGQIHISLKPKRLQLVQEESCSLPTPACPSSLPCQGHFTRWSGSTQLADQTENGTGVMAGGVHCHLGKLPEPLMPQTPKHKVQCTVGSSWLGPRVSAALQQLTATACQTQRKAVEVVSHPPAVSCWLGQRFVTRCFTQPSWTSAFCSRLLFLTTLSAVALFLWVTRIYRTTMSCWYRWWVTLIFQPAF